MKQGRLGLLGPDVDVGLIAHQSMFSIPTTRRAGASSVAWCRHDPDWLPRRSRKGSASRGCHRQSARSLRAHSRSHNLHDCHGMKKVCVLAADELAAR